MKDDDNSGGKKMKYPKSVFFIVLNEFCERFAYYGMRTALSLYFVDILLYKENTATVMYHTFSMCAYFFPVIGAMIADSWLGKFRTILYLSMVYAAGQLLLSVSSVPALNLPVREISILGLFLTALGTGGIKPCVAAFGGDQFKLPQQAAYLTTFFSLFYFSINSGSLISTFITPILRKDVTCFEMNTCYPLAFLVPAVLMIASIIIFFAGKSLYRMKQPEGNIVLKVGKCICHAIARKMKSKGNKRDHWLDYADDEYEITMIDDVKSVLKVLKLFIPLPFFWALFDQQGSRWTFQATRMDGEVFGYLVKPDQFQVVNPLFIILFIPIFQFAIYPVIEKFLFINTPLRKLTVGGLLACLSFVISGFVELSLEPTYVVQPSSGLAQVRIFNTVNCNATLTIDGTNYAVGPLDFYQNINVPAIGTASLNLHTQFEPSCPYISGPIGDKVLVAKETRATTWFITKNGVSESIEDKIQKSKSGDPNVRALIYMDSTVAGYPNVTLNLDSNGKDKYLLNATSSVLSEFNEINHNTYKVTINGRVVDEHMFPRYGGVYTIVGYLSNDVQAVKLVTVAEPNSVHMFWLLPQYVVITMGEIMFSITGLEFAYSQAPVSMKSLLQASWLLTVAFGNLIVIIIAEAQFFDRQVFEFFLFAALMFVDMLIFAIIAKFYKYVTISSTDNSMSDEIILETKQGINNDSYSAEL